MLKDFWFCCIDIRFPGHNKGRLERAALFKCFSERIFDNIFLRNKKK